MSKAPKRPAGVHPKAWFDANDNEWVFGPLVDGKKHGDFTFWRPDGTRCNECHMVMDVPHGPFKRFHENGEVSQDGAFEKGQLHGTRKWFSTDSETTENTRPQGVSEKVWRSEMDYVHGRVVGIRHFNREDERVLPKTGEPYPLKPEGVDEGAEYVEPKDEWHHGSADGDTQKKTGRWRIWTRDGQLKREVHYVDDELFGSAKLMVRPGAEWFTDPSIVMERGKFENGIRARKWQLCDADGEVKATFDYGDVAGLKNSRRVEFSNKAENWDKLAQQREDQNMYVEALLLWARAGAKSGDLTGFRKLLTSIARPVREELALTLAMETEATYGMLGYELIEGAHPAVVLNKIGIALDQAFQSRAALDFTNAAILLDPERSEFLFTRSLILMSLGLKHQAEVDANELAAESPDRAEFLLGYLAALFPSWSFTPATEEPTTTFEDVPAAPSRSLEEVQALSKKYATRLMQFRAKILERVTDANQAVPPELSAFLADGPVELEQGGFELEGEDGESQDIEFDEVPQLDEADLPTLLRLARADWTALSWLCWSAGQSDVAPVTALEPPAEFGKAAGMAQQRLWRSRDQRAFKGRNAQQHGVPSFTWEGLDIADLPPPVAGIAEQQYAEMQAVFLWLTDEKVRSPWQDNLRGS
ncbi:MAG: thiol reductase thioredoxin [Archangium sp.]|nr:thiol reductase thioredoxin [Archangium sp.]